jgi:serine/threonine protein kinase/Tol biopolymer transport system component
MVQERWLRVEQLFHAALERPQEQRPEWLDGACNGDAELRRQVERLLSNEERAGSFLERPAIEDVAVTQTATGSLLGGKFGPYEIVSLLGAGGMGEVYRAHDSKLERDVAIKTLPYEFAGDPERLARFRREARTLASLNHPNIAAIYGLEESGEVDCLVLELVEGETLKGPLPVAQALDLTRQVAEALEAAHASGIIHRDLKPSNVKVTPQGRVKVLDFGLAKAIWGPETNPDLSPVATKAGSQSLPGHIVGTPGYMSPEQASGGDVDDRTDVWAFGCLLYELLTGQRAFSGESTQDTIAAVLEREPDWDALPAKTPAKVRELLRQCLQKDAGRRLQHIADARRTIEDVQRGSKRWQIVATAATIAIVALLTALWMRGPVRPLDRSQWVQLTKFPDSVTQPALSPDGRMVAFVRGDSSFIERGQIYVKMLPDGEPLQLTHDGLNKLSPAFSPDGGRIAYTTVDPAFSWDTWAVPVRGGEPRLLLKNASGLVWTGPRRVMCSEIKKGEGVHMVIVAAGEDRVGARDVYLPADDAAMAHRSYLSPDGKWVLLVQMDGDHLWEPCRLVPADGSSPGRQVGPPGGGCTFGAWSPDGKWMYLTSNAVGTNHIWRQRFPNGTPEQITSGPTEEEGIAMAEDGHSFVTSVSLQSGSLWLHNAAGEREISLEGNAAQPAFTPDGGKLLYRIVREPASQFSFYRDLGEVWVADLQSGRSEPLVRGFRALDYDISPDGRQVVMETEDLEGKPRLWLAPMDRSSAPHQIPNVVGGFPRFGPGGEIFFRRRAEGSFQQGGMAGSPGFVYRVRLDGTGMRKALEQTILVLGSVSPDGGWISAWAPLPGNGPPLVQAFPLDGKPPVAVGWVAFGWSKPGFPKSVWFTPFGFGNGTGTYIVPLAPGQILPPIPAGGFRSEDEIASLPGARRIPAGPVGWGGWFRDLSVYAFYHDAIQRNLYRIPIP